MAGRNQLDVGKPSQLNNNVEVVIESSRTTKECAPIDLTDHEAIKKLCMESLIQIVQVYKGDIRTLGVVREVLDRIVGKPVTPIISQVNINEANKPAPTPAEVLRKWQFVTAMAGDVPMIDVTPKG